MTKYYIIIIVMTMVGSVASLFLKKASASDSILGLIKNKNIYIGGLLYLASAILNIIVLRYISYSIVLPLTSITYIWTLIISRYWLKEKISAKKICGIMLIVIGAVSITI